MFFLLSASLYCRPVEGAEMFASSHIAKVRSVGAVSTSPDGTQVAYTLSVPRRPGVDDDGPAWTELHVIRPDGTAVPFVTGEVNVSSVKWVPGAKAISFLAKRGKDKEQSLYSIPVDGGEARRILSHKSAISDYEWLPDGQTVVFVASDKRTKDKESLEKKGFKAEIYEEELLFALVFMANTAKPDETPRQLKLPGSASGLACSPDGRLLALALSPTPLIDDIYMKSKVHVIDLKTGEIEARVDNPGKLGMIRWSPDSKHLALIAAESLHDPSEGRLMVVPASGGAPRDLLSGFEGEVTSIAWRDRETLLFLADEGCWSTLNEIRFDGTERKTILPTGQFVLAGLSLAPEGATAAFTGQSATHPNEVFLLRSGKSAPVLVTDSNPWLKDMRYAPQRVIRYHARDGLELEGLLIEPLDFETGRRYPLIVTVHGGPEAHYRNGWLNNYGDPGQTAAAKGFAVFYPNYRGSTGRGVKFSMLGQADYGGAEFNDLVDGVDHLVNEGLVDKARVGVTGGSYGGYATAWCSTYYSERFAAGVMFVGISDQISKAGTTDIPNEMTLVHAQKRLWDDWDFFLQRSPIRHVEKARTPLLILHGKDDTRVHPSQSMELYRHLKVLGQTPVRLVWYPGEGHGNRKAAARYDYHLRMLQWFEHYLLGPGGTPPPPRIDYGLPAAGEEDSNPKQD